MVKQKAAEQAAKAQAEAQRAAELAQQQALQARRQAEAQAQAAANAAQRSANAAKDAAKKSGRKIKKFFSDIRVKENIKLENVDAVTGLSWYSYNYVWDSEVRQTGVMAQDLLGTKYQDAVSVHHGHFVVDYSKLPN
jgi:multidrug efflux pump subunit AcrA (membrane-fusion protein)